MAKDDAGSEGHKAKPRDPVCGDCLANLRMIEGSWLLGYKKHKMSECKYGERPI